MGLDANGTKFLLYAKSKGVDFTSTATIGRQWLLVSDRILAANIRESGTDISTASAASILAAGKGFCEPFLEFLGAASVTSFDASDYESATVVHDLNKPIGDEYRSQFSAVIDGGTLEHVFNFPIALKNCMEMVSPGGHFLAITPTNNFAGHGFYQFSPELFFNVLDEPNGFEMREMIMFEDRVGAPWYRVSDPKAVRDRVTMVNNRPTYLLVFARRTAEVSIYDPFPQQSDYSAAWQTPSDDEAERAKHGNSWASRLLRRLSMPAMHNRLDERFFERFDPFK
ncbi:MAG: class I SAM-dependent methyltransferase [Pyrinomonadaceae bacterium]